MTPTADRLVEIAARLQAFEEHRNDAYAYDKQEIDAVREFFNKANLDVAWLLAELARVTADRDAYKDELDAAKVEADRLEKAVEKLRAALGTEGT